MEKLQSLTSDERHVHYPVSTLDAQQPLHCRGCLSRRQQVQTWRHSVLNPVAGGVTHCSTCFQESCREPEQGMLSRKLAYSWTASRCWGLS